VIHQFNYQFRRYVKNTFYLKGHQIKLNTKDIDSEKQFNVFVFDIKDKQFILHVKGDNRFGGLRFYLQSKAFMDKKNIGIKILDQKINTYGFGTLKHNSFEEMLSTKVGELQFHVPKSPLFKKVEFSSCEVTNKGVYLKIQKLSLNHDNIIITRLIKSNFK
jgi:hypothetical protein